MKQIIGAAEQKSSDRAEEQTIGKKSFMKQIIGAAEQKSSDRTEE